MKICFVTKSDYNVIKNIGRIRELPKELKKLGNDISLFSAVYKKTKSNNDVLEGFSFVKLIYIGGCSFFMSIIYFLKLNHFFLQNRKIISEIDFFILDYNSVIPLLIFVLLSKLNILKVRFILDVRTIPVEVNGIKGILAYAEYYVAIQLSGLLFDGMTAITEEISKNIKAHGFNRNKRIGIWTSGVNTMKFNVNVSPISIKGFIGKRDFVIVHHGVLSFTRGIIELIKSIPIVLKSDRCIKLLIIGDGPAYGYIEDYIKKSNLDENMMLTGTIRHDKLPHYLAASNAGIIPLPDINWWRVSSPQKLFEYLAMGKNVIVSDILAHRSVLGNNAFTIYLDEITPECIAEKIIYSSIKWKGIKIEPDAAKLVESKYTWKDQANKLNNYLLGVYE